MRVAIDERRNIAIDQRQSVGAELVGNGLEPFRFDLLGYPSTEKLGEHRQQCDHAETDGCAMPSSRANDPTPPAALIASSRPASRMVLPILPALAPARVPEQTNLELELFQAGNF